MSFTHETLISALRDVIREEMRSIIVEIAKDEESDFAMELDRQIGLKIESNGEVCSMKEQIDYMSDHENRIDSLEDKISDLDIDDLDRRIEILENNSSSDVTRILEMLHGINRATNDAGSMY